MVKLRKKLEEIAEKIRDRTDKFYDPDTDEISIPEEWQIPESEDPVDTELDEGDSLPWIPDIEDEKDIKKVLPTLPIPYKLRLSMGFIALILCVLGTGLLLTSANQDLNSLIFMIPVTCIQLDYLLKTWVIVNRKWYYFAELKKKES